MQTVVICPSKHYPWLYFISFQVNSLMASLITYWTFYMIELVGFFTKSSRRVCKCFQWKGILQKVRAWLLAPLREVPVLRRVGKRYKWQSPVIFSKVNVSSITLWNLKDDRQRHERWALRVVRWGCTASFRFSKVFRSWRDCDQTETNHRISFANYVDFRSHLPRLTVNDR
jgi:hypothetical protein